MVCRCVAALLRRELTLGTGTFEYEEYISLRSINDPNEGQVKCLGTKSVVESENTNTRQIRNHYRPDASARSDRILPEAHLLAISWFEQQRMQNLSAGTSCCRELWYIQIHNQHATCHALV